MNLSESVITLLAVVILGALGYSPLRQYRRRHRDPRDRK